MKGECALLGSSPVSPPGALARCAVMRLKGLRALKLG